MLSFVCNRLCQFAIYVWSALVTSLESILHFTVAEEHKFARAMSKRKSYDVSFKLKAVEYAEKKSKEAAAREMGVDSKRIREWPLTMLSFMIELGACES